MTMNHPKSVEDVVSAGLCIGCGLCEALQPDRWKMQYTEAGKLRPVSHGPGSDADILQACPGAVAQPNEEAAPQNDAIWGTFHNMTEASAGDETVRHRAATGGVLTALGMALLASGKAKFILHCEAIPQQPMRTRWCISETPDQVLARAGSRYGPSDTLAGLTHAVSRDEPFAIIAKPCDAGAIRQRAKVDPVLKKNLVAVLVMVCGGASDLGKSKAVLEDFNVKEEELQLFRYRGYGNPGFTRVETASASHTKTYNEMWDDQSGWRIQSRCKVCPDALGEAADIAAADIWPGGNPNGEEEEKNGIIIRTAAGKALYEEALASGYLGKGADITPREFDVYQPHQVRKKHALAARLRGMSAAGSPVYAHENLRIEDLDSADERQEAGTKQRVLDGKFKD